MLKKYNFLLVIFLFTASCAWFPGRLGIDDKSKNIYFKKLRDDALLPGWFFSPSPGNTIGSLGMARALSVGGSPKEHARANALKGVLGYYGLKPNIRDKNYKALIKGEVKKAKIGGKDFSIPNLLKSKDYIVARAASGSKSNSFSKNIKDFSPFECTPGWICSPASGKTGGVLGVSYRAISPQRQYELAIKNGLLLMKYAYGVDVCGEEEIRRLKSGTGMVRLRKNKMSFKLLGDKNHIQIYVKEVRYFGETLYVWLVSPDLPRFEKDNRWRNSNISKGTIGECGKTGSGLLSSQIEKAVERAVFEMAKNRDVGIEVIESTERGGHSSFFDQYINSSVDTKVFPSLRGFYLDREDKVHVWLVPK